MNIGNSLEATHPVLIILNRDRVFGNRNKGTENCEHSRGRDGTAIEQLKAPTPFTRRESGTGYVSYELSEQFQIFHQLNSPLAPSPHGLHSLLALPQRVYGTNLRQAAGTPSIAKTFLVQTVLLEVAYGQRIHHEDHLYVECQNENDT